MYSEKRIRQILHEFKMKREFFKKISEDELRKNYWNEHVHLEEKIILLETILEESAWQKLMGQAKKKRWHHSIFCWHEWKWKERAYTMFKQCVKCGVIK